jgi:hypothetical protein
MTVGQKLAAVEPSERSVERAFKRAVNSGAVELVQEYLNEIAPHLGDVDLPGLLELIPANVLTREQVDRLADQYDQVPDHLGGATGIEAFASLYDMGLLGLVHTDPISGEKVQRFLSPGEFSFGSARALPASRFYLVRSVLSGYMSGINGEYAQQTDRTNIIGDGRTWHEPDPGRFGEKPPPAYEGDEPFVYVCYSHDDARSVMSEIAWLSQKGVHIWYDGGIPAGSRWSDELASRIRGSSAFLYFISDRSVSSNHCVNEVNFVADLNKPTIAVYLQETELPDGLKLMLGATQTIRRYDTTAAAYRRQIETVLLDCLTRE